MNSYIQEFAPGWKCVPNYSHAVNGRIWVIWNPATIHFAPITVSDQFVHGHVHLLQSRKEILLTAIYARNYGGDRKRLWDFLKATPNSDIPWIACGDYNIIRFMDEKFGGSNPAREDMEDFNNCIDFCSLHDLKSVGETLSWSNNSRVGDLKLRRLDRALVNDDWISSFPNSFVKYKSSIISDHSPLVIHLQDCEPKDPKPFRFLNAWLDDLSLYEQVERACKLKLVKTAIKTWNKNIFGRVDIYLPIVRNDLENAQAEVKANPSSVVLRNKADDLKDLFLQTAKQEESIIRQKSRNFWLTKEDTNSSFFHAAVRARRNRNNIYGTSNDQGEIITDPDSIASIYVDYFARILNAQFQTPDPSDIPEPSKKLTTIQSEWLTRPILKEEIENVIRFCDGDKSPGPDGFNGQFFKSFWYLIGDEVCSAILDFFKKGKLLKSVNSTFICLIPKKSDSNSPDQYRPISLCNFLYKIISKILASRLKTILIDIISPNQSAFVLGRLIQENILLTNDLIHNFHKQSVSSPPAMCLKLDLRKAFDNVCRQSLLLFMKKMGFNVIWCHWISQCISDPCFSILINGSPKGFFSSANGLRQGDPLSPLLFCIVMEMFSCIFNEASHSNLIRTPFARGDLHISHLLFADDVVLFASADHLTTSNINICLEKFSKCSGLSINSLKSEVFFSGGDQNLKLAISQSLGIPEGKFPVSYLGLPLVPSRLRSSHCQPMISKIRKRIDAWNNRHLSRAGRLELIQSVLNSLHLYWSAAFTLPQSTMDEIERIFRTFLWSGSDLRKCYHPISWETVCLTKEEGGIGIRRLQDLNKASKMKLFWNIAAGKKSLWADWVRKKYIRSRNLWLMKNPSRPSWGFRGIIQARSLLEPFVCYSIGKGTGIDFWNQPWHPDGIIRNKTSIVALSNNTPANCSVNDLLFNGEWSQVFDLPTHHDLKKILQNSILNHTDEDSAIWMPNPSGHFSLKSAWETIRLHSNRVPWHNSVWFSGNIPKHAFTCWQAIISRLLTNDRLIRHGLRISPNCFLCLHSAESANHLFFDCGFSKWIWGTILRNLNFKRKILNLHLEEEWIRSKFKGNGQLSTAIRLLFQATIYSIWSERNERAHNKPGKHKQHVLSHILSLVKSKLVALQRNDVPNQNSSCCAALFNLPCHPKDPTPKLVSWVKPPPAWVKINTDASLLNDSGGLGGLIRNPEGNCLKFFSVRVKNQPIYLLELQALLRGIQLAARHHFPHVWLESDSSSAVNMINGNSQCTWKAIPTLAIIKKTLLNFNAWRISHIWREGNAAADLLSKIDFPSKGEDLDLLINDGSSPRPSPIQDFLDQIALDSSRAIFTRLPQLSKSSVEGRSDGDTGDATTEVDGLPRHVILFRSYLAKHVRGDRCNHRHVGGHLSMGNPENCVCDMESCSERVFIKMLFSIAWVSDVLRCLWTLEGHLPAQLVCGPHRMLEHQLGLSLNGKTGRFPGIRSGPRLEKWKQLQLPSLTDRSEKERPHPIRRPSGAHKDGAGRRSTTGYHVSPKGAIIKIKSEEKTSENFYKDSQTNLRGLDLTGFVETVNVHCVGDDLLIKNLRIENRIAPICICIDIEFSVWILAPALFLMVKTTLEGPQSGDSGAPSDAQVRYRYHRYLSKTNRDKHAYGGKKSLLLHLSKGEPFIGLEFLHHVLVYKPCVLVHGKFLACLPLVVELAMQ
ncbi:uncharacterized protein LOC143861414 [Tasmannia lanceolata]|uniref:uncharacterized protein LOC143861414 n=1 Tax=Tasmannia lanceolata TaxID=3420 RepID=UPI004063BB8B